MTKPVVTYLLGAGASANSVPIAKDFIASMKSYKEIISREYKPTETHFPSEFQISISIKDTVAKFFNNIDEIEKGSSIFNGSIDEYAHQLYIREDYDKLLILKSTISAFLLLAQTNNPVDTRYNSFFAHILRKENDIVVPNNFNILTWNYDFQIDKAYRNFRTISDPVSFFLEIQSLPISGYKYEFELNKFCVIRINGLAGLHDLNGNYQRYTFINDNKFNINTITRIFAAYSQYIEGFHQLLPLINYGWERKNRYSIETIKHAIEIAKMTDVLIIIGYSFPFLNRDSDKEILSNMINLSSVCIQNSSSGFTSIVKSIIPNNDIEIFEYNDISRFYIPHEARQ